MKYVAVRYKSHPESRASSLCWKETRLLELPISFGNLLKRLSFLVLRKLHAYDTKELVARNIGPNIIRKKTIAKKMGEIITMLSKNKTRVCFPSYKNLIFTFR